VQLYLKALEYRGQNTKLTMYIMQALDRFFAWDKENNGGAGESSVIAYFEAEGGYKLLEDISTNVSNMELYTVTIEVMQRYFPQHTEEEDINYFFT